MTAVTILLDVIQLGLYFDDAEDVNGDGNSKRKTIIIIPYGMKNWWRS